MADLDKWANRQIAAALLLGINPLDALAAVKAALVVLPPDADPDAFVAPTVAMWQEITQPEFAQDALVAFVARPDVPNRFKLILAARARGAVANG